MIYANVRDEVGRVVAWGVPCVSRSEAYVSSDLFSPGYVARLFETMTASALDLADAEFVCALCGGEDDDPADPLAMVKGSQASYKLCSECASRRPGFCRACGRLMSADDLGEEDCSCCDDGTRRRGR